MSLVIMIALNVQIINVQLIPLFVRTDIHFLIMAQIMANALHALLVVMNAMLMLINAMDALKDLHLRETEIILLMNAYHAHLAVKVAKLILIIVKYAKKKVMA